MYAIMVTLGKYFWKKFDRYLIWLLGMCKHVCKWRMSEPLNMCAIFQEQMFEGQLMPHLTNFNRDSLKKEYVFFLTFFREEKSLNPKLLKELIFKIALKLFLIELLLCFTSWKCIAYLFIKHILEICSSKHS